MAKKARVYDGTAWQELASAQTDLTAYSTTAQMNTAITAASGLTLISTTSVTVAAAAISVNDCFSATYDNYFAIVELTPVSTGTLNFRFRNAGSDRTDSAYTYNSTAYNSAGTLAGNYGSGTSAVIMQSYTAINGNAVLQIQNPFLSKVKYLQNHYYTVNSAGSNTSGTSGAIYATANSNDGFSIFSSAGNITGKITVYGYVK